VLRGSLASRGVLMTPLHTMALIAPQTAAADVDRGTGLLRKAARTSAG